MVVKQDVTKRHSDIKMTDVNAKYFKVNLN